MKTGVTAIIASADDTRSRTSVSRAVGRPPLVMYAASSPASSRSSTCSKRRGLAARAHLGGDGVGELVGEQPGGRGDGESGGDDDEGAGHAEAPSVTASTARAGGLDEVVRGVGPGGDERGVGGRVARHVGRAAALELGAQDGHDLAAEDLELLEHERRCGRPAWSMRNSWRW